MTRAATMRTKTIVAPDPRTAVVTMTAATTLSTPTAFAVNP